MNALCQTSRTADRQHPSRVVFGGLLLGIVIILVQFGKIWKKDGSMGLDLSLSINNRQLLQDTTITTPLSSLLTASVSLSNPKLIEPAVNQMISTTTVLNKNDLFPSIRAKGVIPPTPLMANFKPEQGLESVAFRIIDVPTVQAYLFHHFGAAANTTKLVYFVTPTHKRISQMADLIRLANTLDHDPAIYWIIVEDAKECSKRVRDVLDRTGLPYAHVAVPTPNHTVTRKGYIPAKGVEQRNVALDVIEYLGMEGVVYFGDDDNAYDVRMFPELRRTKRVGTFGVAYAGGGTYERCMVNPQTGKIAKFVTSWIGDRKFPVDMGGLSFHTSVLLTEQRPRFSHDWGLGYLETKFLQLFLKSSHEFEPLMDNCTTIYVWHVTTTYPYQKTKKVPMSMEKQDSLHSKILPSV